MFNSQVSGDIEYLDRDAGLYWFDHAAWVARARIRRPHWYSAHASDFVDVLCWAFAEWHQNPENPDATTPTTEEEEDTAPETEQTTLITDGGQCKDVISRTHPSEPPAFEFEKGQSFKLANEPPDEYWYITARVWNYDANTDDALVQARAYKQYVIAEVSSLGEGEHLVTEDTLIQHYETVSRETAKQALNLGGDDGDGRDDPTRSEPADFSGGDSTGVQDL